MESCSGVSSSNNHPMRPEGGVSQGGIPLCYCGIPSKLRTSAQPNSFGRRFFNCRHYKAQKQCGFFEWLDLAWNQPDCCKHTLELAERRNERLAGERARIEDAKFQSMKMKYKCAMITSWVLFITLLCSLKISKLNNNVNHLMLS